MKSIICILAIIGFASCQELFPRPCRTFEELGVKTNFDPKRYLNRWYEIERYDQRFQRDSDCVTATYTENPIDGSIIVLNEAQFIENGTRISDTGRAVLSFPNEDPLRGLLNVTFSAVQPNTVNYWVLDTDYVTFAVVVSCSNVPIVNQSAEAYWLLSRTEQLSGSGRQRADEIKGKFLDASRVRVTNQDRTLCRR